MIFMVHQRLRNALPFRHLATIFLFLATLVSAPAASTNYFCIVCGKGPLRHAWLHPRGPICDDCEQLPDRCSICFLPVKDGDGHIKTGDGRFICKFDRPNVVLTLDQAQELFEQTRADVVDLYGPAFVLKYPEVTVNLFDVDYWSEKGQANGLHKYGFASTRSAGNGVRTHEVVMLSGRTREEMTAVAAHEYTHLWINENCPPGHHIDGDTVEAICELTAYLLMEKKQNPEQQQRILENPYTNGKIKDLIAVEHEGGTDYVLNWVRQGTAETFDADARLAPLPTPAVAAPRFAAPRPLPTGLKFSGIISFGAGQMAVINGEEFASGDKKTLKLRNHSVNVRCLEIHAEKIAVNVDGRSLTLERGVEATLP